MSVQVSREQDERLKDEFVLESRGKIEVKTQGEGGGGLPDPSCGGPMNCRTCGAQISPGRRFCTACGTPLTEAPVIIACTACGGSNPVDAKFCAECGKAFEADTTATPKSPQTTPERPESGRQASAAERRQLISPGAGNSSINAGSMRSFRH
jgi:predicted amidophosphoribosyltransferase